MPRLFVLYDARCALCRRLQAWVTSEPAWWPVTAVASGSAQGRRMFPGLESGELTVVASDGRYWRGDHAWLVVLFALKRYRRWAKRLAHPLLLPLARQAFAVVSEHRGAVGWWLGLRSFEETARHLRQQAVPACEVHPRTRKATMRGCDIDEQSRTNA